jgi:hypothetical protein
MMKRNLRPRSSGRVAGTSLEVYGTRGILLLFRTSMPPRLISVTAGVQAIHGAIWDGSAFTTKDSSGDYIHPMVNTETPTGVIPIPEEFATRADSTAYSVGDKFAVISDNGNWLWAICTEAGTTAASKPSYLESDIGDAAVTDNTADFLVKGYATLHKGGAVLEDASTNEILQSRDPDTTWTQRGTFSAVQDITGADGVANSGWTLSGIDTGANDMFQPLSGLGNTVRYEPSLILKQIDVAGVVAVHGTNSGADGAWLIDLSKLNTHWEVVDRNHPAVTISTEFTSTAAGAGIIQILKSSGTGTLSVGYYNCQAEVESFSTSQIFTTTGTVTKAKSTFSDTTTGRMLASSWAVEWVGTPEGVGQENTIFASYVDADNYTAIITTATTVVLRERVGGVNTDLTETFTHGVLPIKVQAYHDGTNNGVRAFNVGDTPSTWHTQAHATDSQIGTTFENCSNGNGADGFYAHNISLQVTVDKTDLGY